MTPQTDTFISQAEAAKRLGITRSAVSLLLDRQLLPYTTIAGRRVVTLSAVEAFVKNRPLPGWAGYHQKKQRAKNLSTKANERSASSSKKKERP